jgi:pilus assembly protein CpaB
LLLILVLAIFSGLAAGYSALLYLRDRPSPIVQADPRETSPVVVAARDLPLGTVLGTEDVRVVEWPGGVVPVGFATAPEEVVGRSLIANVNTNEPILSGKLADTGLMGLIPLIPAGMRALSVAVDQVVAVAGFVTPQTRVDVILIMTPPGGREPISKIILQNLQALAAGQQIQETEEGEPIIVTVITVLVSPAQAEKLALASTQGRIQMTLRNTTDLEMVETAGERTSQLFAGAAATRTSGARTIGSAEATRESILEIYQGGVRTLISY